MSRYCGDRDSKPTLEAAEHWRENGLLTDGSIFSEKTLWKLEHLQALDQYFVNQLDEGEGNFFEKLSTQLGPTVSEVKKLAAELLWVMSLCPSNVSAPKKREGIQTIWAWSEESFPVDSPWLQDAVLAGVGSAGTSYNTSRWRELVFVIRVMIAFKQIARADREEILKDGWTLAKWLEQIPECDNRQFRHMMLFLLFPDSFERIFGGTERRKIVTVLSGKLTAQVKTLSALEVDRELSAIRQQQELTYGTNELDFYVPPLRDLWVNNRNVAWLLTWVPNKWEWESLAEDRTTTHDGETVTIQWSCANRKAAVGDKAYLAKLGVPPKGIVAIGNIVTAPYEAPHWDEEKATAGKTSWYVDVAFSRIQDPLVNDPYLSIEDLNKITIDQQNWAPQSSGIKIKQRSADIVNELWEKAVGPIIIPPEAPDTNRILYGPPGTGKTYDTINQALSILGEDTNRDRKELHELFQKYREEGRIGFVTFHQSFSYEDFIEGIKPLPPESSENESDQLVYHIEDGIFKKMCGLASGNDDNYVLIIDEINRGNVANIFGELITLIEEDKRAGNPEGLTAVLPYSKKEFSVPPNLYIVGTMNTADRSVEALDSALRRRFTFIEKAPEPELIDQPEDLDVDLKKLLVTVNNRIEVLLDKDHCIGHSYFMNIHHADNSLNALKEVFSNKILPLLEEYFYGNPVKIGMVLGNSFVEKKTYEDKKNISFGKGYETALDDFERETVYRIINPMKFTDTEPFKSIYE